jgi:hypothetical protein
MRKKINTKHIRYISPAIEETGKIPRKKDDDDSSRKYTKNTHSRL